MVNRSEMPVTLCDGMMRRPKARDSMSTAADVRVESIFQAPSLDEPAQNKSWESVKEAHQDAGFVAGSTTEVGAKASDC